MNRYTVTSDAGAARDPDISLRAGGARLVARRWPGFRAGEPAEIVIRPEDVLLAAEHPGRISARNVLPGHARNVRQVPEGVYVTVDVGFRLTALVTRAAVADLRIRRGSALYAIIKATAIAPAAASPARVRGVLVGARGSVEPKRIALLREIEDTGSLSAAARALGITYRTAWSWARAINRTMGIDLVAPSRGGGGGGGSRLTPEGRAALDQLARLEAAASPHPRARKGFPRRAR